MHTPLAIRHRRPLFIAGWEVNYLPWEIRSTISIYTSAFKKIECMIEDHSWAEHEQLIEKQSSVLQSAKKR